MKQTALIILLVASLLGGGCAPDQGFDARLSPIVKPYLFSIAGWESQAIPDEIKQRVSGRQEAADDETGVVTEYFEATERIKTLRSAIAAARAGDSEGNQAPLEAELKRLQTRKKELKGTVDRVIEKQIRDVLARQGIFNPIIEWPISFPPLNFRLEEPPHLLVISPRDKIESMREIALKPGVVLAEIEGIETGVDGLGVSSLVVKLGGLGATYPTLVTDEASLRFTIETAAEEWLHQYLAFKPLGFRYLLDVSGLSRNYDIATMNETLAGIVSQEIGSLVYGEYYSALEDSTRQDQEEEIESAFNREMREIRKQVDRHLARGEIEQAEEFMEEQRQRLADMGYHIRKLNQAYFAFHGTYADKPAFISPIGLELKELRKRSKSLKDFLNTAAVLTSRQELMDAIR